VRGRSPCQLDKFAQGDLLPLLQPLNELSTIRVGEKSDSLGRMHEATAISLSELNTKNRLDLIERKLA